MQTTGEVETRFDGGALEVVPTDRTREFASVRLKAAPGAAIDARACGFLSFQIRSLEGASGVQRAPSLRVGVSDAGGLSRQPLLARYAEMDPDPAAWQQVLVPMRDVLDRGVDAGAIASVSWQFTGFPAPFAVRRVVLVPGQLGTEAPPARLNLLPDPSFEKRKDARPLWSLVGDYRDLSQPGSAALEKGEAADGERFLRIHRAYFFEAMGPRSPTAGFTAALRSQQAGAAEIGCEIVAVGGGGGIGMVGRKVRQVQLTGGWRRFALSTDASSQPPPGEGPLRLYRAWVRPLSNAPVDVDAVCLAPVEADASFFEPGRANPILGRGSSFRRVRNLMEYRPRTNVWDTPTPAGLQADLPPLKVPLEVREWAGRPWKGAVAAGAIPLAPRTVYSPDALRVLGPDGKEVPSQVQVLRRDPQDGSVRCLWLALQADVPAGARAPFSLESGATSAGKEPPLAAEVADGVVINTGAVRLRIPRDRFPPFAEMQWGDAVFPAGPGGIRLELLDGRLLASVDPPSRLSIERSGPLSVVVYVRGYLSAVDDGPTPRFLYTARIRAWRGAPGVQVDLAVTNLTPEPATPVRSLALVLPLGRSRRVDGALGRQGAEPLAASLGPADFLRLTQRRDAFREGREDVYVEKAGAPPEADAGRAAGWARWQAPGLPPLLLAIANMAERAPAALEVSRDGMAAYLVPPAGVGAFDFPFGLTAYGEFWIGSGEAPDLALSRLERPPLLGTTPAQASAAGVFGRFLLPEEMHRRFPLLALLFDREMALWLDAPERTGRTGWLTDPDAGDETLPCPSGTDDVEGLYLQYLRTGDPITWRRARQQLLHLREVSTWWSNESSAFQSANPEGAFLDYGADPEQLRTTGLLYDYWVTGDRRSLDVADGLGAEMLSGSGTVRYGGVQGIDMLMQLARLYVATGRRLYREAYEELLRRPADGTPPAPGAEPPAVASNLPPSLATRVLADLPALEAYLRRENPPTALGDPDGVLLDRTLPHVRAADLPKSDWDSALGVLSWRFLAPYTRAACLPPTTRILLPMAGLELPEPAWTKGVPLGLSPYSANGRPFTVRIYRNGSEPVHLQLCRLRAYLPVVGRRYRVQAALRDPLGRLIGRQEVLGTTCAAQSISLPGLGVTGDYTLSITSDEDGLAELITTHPRTFLRADEWKKAREGQAQGSFYLRAPAGGEVSVAVRASASAALDGMVAATLRAPDGSVLSRARWRTPCAGTDAEGNPPAEEFPAAPLRLPFPAAYRGRPLLLEITSARGTEWCVQGLGEPWLAATPAAFE